MFCKKNMKKINEEFERHVCLANTKFLILNQKNVYFTKKNSS